MRQEWGERDDPSTRTGGVLSTLIEWACVGLGLVVFAAQIWATVYFLF